MCGFITANFHPLGYLEFPVNLPNSVNQNTLEMPVAYPMINAYTFAPMLELIVAQDKWNGLLAKSSAYESPKRAAFSSASFRAAVSSAGVASFEPYFFASHSRSLACRTRGSRVDQDFAASLIPSHSERIRSSTDHPFSLIPCNQPGIQIKKEPEQW
jgi:hypothetical protein